MSWGAVRLRRAGIGPAEREAQELLGHILRLTRPQFLAGLDQAVRPDPVRRYRRLIARRARRIPLQYVLGYEEFAGLKFKVGPGVLIPRPETELILEAAARLRVSHPMRWIADLGTGSGNLALALAARFPQARVYAVENSARALRWARLNRRRLGLKNVHFRLGRADAPLPVRWRGRFGLVVSNPPYVPRADLPRLQAEVQREPRPALDGGLTGLEGIRRLGAAAFRLLAPEGVFICEIGYGQEPAASRILLECGFSAQVCDRDWHGIPRIITAFK